MLDTYNLHDKKGHQWTPGDCATKDRRGTHRNYQGKSTKLDGRKQKSPFMSRKLPLWCKHGHHEVLDDV